MQVLTPELKRQVVEDFAGLESKDKVRIFLRNALQNLSYDERAALVMPLIEGIKNFAMALELSAEVVQSFKDKYPFDFVASVTWDARYCIVVMADKQPRQYWFWAVQIGLHEAIEESLMKEQALWALAEKNITFDN